MIGGVDQTKLNMRAFILSTNDAVKASDITLSIESPTRGRIPVQLGTNGDILNFPHEKTLLREDQPVFSNQPKGTLKMVVSLSIPVPDNLSFRYARLADGTAELNKLIKAKAGLLSFIAPKAKGVVFVFPKASGGKAKVTVVEPSGPKEFIAGPDGQVKLKLDKSLVKANPEIKLSEKPEGVVPDID